MWNLIYELHILFVDFLYLFLFGGLGFYDIESADLIYMQPDFLRWLIVGS